MKILTLLSVVVCCTAVVTSLSADVEHKEKFEHDEEFGIISGPADGGAIAKSRSKRYVGSLVGAIASVLTFAITTTWFGIEMHDRNHRDRRAIDKKYQLDLLSMDLKDISAQMQQLGFLNMSQSTNDYFEFIDKIRNFSDILSSERHGSNEILVSAILDSDGGIHQQLHRLNKLITGEASFADGFGSVYEPFLVKLFKMHTHGRDMNNFKPVKDLHNLMYTVLTEFWMQQALGYQVYEGATRLKMNSTNGGVVESQLHKISTERLSMFKQQIESVSVLLAECPPIRLPKEEWLDCTDGFRFGSICHQVCNYPDYPNKGYEPVQCLLNGEWSFNINGQTRAMCTSVPDSKDAVKSKLGFFLSSDTMCYNGDCTMDSSQHGTGLSSYSCEGEDGIRGYCLPTIRPGYGISDPGRKCKSVCVAKGNSRRGFCEDGDGQCQSCVPEIWEEDPDFTTDLCSSNCLKHRIKSCRH